MNSRAPVSALKRRLAIGAVCILTLSGFGFLYSVLAGDSHGLRAWLLPFGPWFCALIGYRLLGQSQKE